MSGQLRRKLSSFILWCAFAALYLGGLLLLIIGLAFASQEWWMLIQHHASAWAISTKTAEVLILAVGFILALVIPIVQRRAAGHSELWRSERRSEMKGRAQATD